MKKENEVKHAANQVLKAYGLQRELPRFLGCPDGFALLAHMCNAAAKFIDPDFYEIKGLLVQAAADAHPFAWHRAGIVYIETCVGQVSFHVFEDVDVSLLPVRQTPWAGGWMQDGAELMARAFLSEDLCHEFEQWIQEQQR